MRFMVCSTGKPEEFPYIPQIRELDAGVELQSYGLNGCQSLEAWEQRLMLHQEFRNQYTGRLAVHGPFIGIDYAYSDHFLQDAVRKRMDMTFDAVKILHADRVILHTGFKLEVLQFNYKDFWLEETSRFWQQEIRRYAELGIIVVLENVIEPDPEIMIGIHDRVNSPFLKLCLDIGHINIWSKLPAALWIEQIGTRLGHVHVHDNTGRFDQHLPIGDGNIDFNAVFEALYEFAAEASVSLEVDSDPDTVMENLRGLISKYRL